MSDLPVGWALTTIGDVIEPFENRDPKREPQAWFDYIDIGSIDNTTQRITAPKRLLGQEAPSRARRLVRTDDVLFSTVRTYLKNIAKVPPELDGALTSTGIALLRPSSAVDSSYLFHWVCSAPFVADLSQSQDGTLYPAVSDQDVTSAVIKLPPLPEQRRIVEKLDALTARTARARADLDRIPALAARYKQAVLAKAFSGELTADWRIHQTALPSADEVNALVRNSWNAVSVGTSRRKGPTSDAEAGRQPVDLGSLPTPWVQMTLETITDPSRLIQYGILKPGDHYYGGVPYVKVMNIKGGVVELEKIRRTTPEIHASYKRSSLREGDLLLSIRGTVGRLAVVPSELDGGNITQDSVRIAVLPTINRRFVYWFLHSPAAQDYFKANQKGVAVRGINVGDVRPMEVPMCSPEEQDEIVRRVEHALSDIDRMVTEAAASRRLLDRLDQAILAKAFRGELVPQDPSDKPASVLLDRIRAERANTPKATRGRNKATAA